MLLEDSVLVYRPVTSDGVTSSPGLEFGSLIWAVSEPPVDGVNGGLNMPVAELIEQTVLSTLAVKLPPALCAQAADDPKKANATKARPGSVSFVIIELVFMLFPFVAAPEEERLVNGGSPETNTAPPGLARRWGSHLFLLGARYRGWLPTLSTKK